MSKPSDERGSKDISSGPPQEIGAECQPLSVWWQVCAGTLADDVAVKYLAHAAECRDCSNLLSEANIDFVSAATPDEQQVLETLTTSTRAGQAELAERITERAVQQTANGQVAQPRSRWFPAVQIFAWGALAACIIAVAVLFVFRRSSDAKLLAEAYDQHRPSELRLPDTEPGPLASPTRGPASPIDSSDLLRLKLRTQQSFEKRPNDPRVRQMLGRIALVQHNGDAALNQFEIARSLDPNLPGLAFDRGAAYFERAESGHPEEYGQAIQLFNEHLQQHNQDAAAYFNLGLAWERQAITTEAISAFQHALSLETDPKWKQEIERHLTRLKRSAEFDQLPSLGHRPLSAASFLSSQGDTPGLYESLLGVAGREWLPHRGDDPKVDEALQRLANLGLAHEDHWLADMLDVPPSAMRRSNDQMLARALSASSVGNTDESLAASATAMDLYRRVGNRAGYLRAAVEHLYALQRMGMERQCLSEAASLLNDPLLNRYSWLRSYLGLEVSAAHAMLGDAVQAREISSAIAATTRSALPLLSLRATSFTVNANVRLQHYAPAWEEAIAGLRTADMVVGTAMPRFQLLSALTEIARGLNLSWTKAGLADAAAEAAQRTGNRQTTAYAMEELALDQLQTGDVSAASSSFQAADNLLRSLGAGLAQRRYEADWSTDRVLLLARDRGPAAAVRTLEREEPAYKSADAALPRLHFYTEYADLLRQAHNTKLSLDKSLVAITDAEHHLANFRTRTDHQGWPAETQRPYEILVWDLSQEDPALALRAWRWVQSARYREGRPFKGEIAASELSSFLPPLPEAREGHVEITIAKILDRYIAWSIEGGRPSARQQILDTSPESIQNRGSALSRLCSDPHSSEDDIAVLGRALYGDLLAPFGDQIAKSLQIDLYLDPSLANIPFAALRDEKHLLGIEHSLSFLIPSGSAADLVDQGRADRLPERPKFVVLKESAAPSMTLIPPNYDESGVILSLFPEAQLRSAMLSRDGAELALGGPPDLPSLLSRATVVHYVGHGLEDTSQSTEEDRRIDPVMKLSGHSLSHCRLAVLAACQTLRERDAETEDVPSFARIILAAGASHVLATEWDVDSRVTSHLMQQFYADLAKGDSFGDALRRAQQSIEADPSSRHPYFWSGFELVGTK